MALSFIKFVSTSEPPNSGGEEICGFDSGSLLVSFWESFICSKRVPFSSENRALPILVSIVIAGSNGLTTSSYLERLWLGKRFFPHLQSCSLHFLISQWRHRPSNCHFLCASDGDTYIIPLITLTNVQGENYPKPWDNRENGWGTEMSRDGPKIPGALRSLFMVSSLKREKGERWSGQVGA